MSSLEAQVVRIPHRPTATTSPVRFPRNTLDRSAARSGEELAERTSVRQTTQYGITSGKVAPSVEDVPRLFGQGSEGLSSSNAQPRYGHDFSHIPLVPGSSAPALAAESPKAMPCPLALTTPRACPFGGACHTCPVRVQAKMAVSQLGDAYEQQADQAAEEMMRTGAGLDLRGGGVLRTLNCPTVQRECADCEDEENLARKANCPGGNQEEFERSAAAPPIVSEVLRSPGAPLDVAARAFFEPRIGRDLSRVRVHTDARAGDSANAVNALAYTVGRDVVFAPGRYAPDEAEGKKLLAHELAHTVQQRQSTVSPIGTVGPPADPYEEEADQVAEDLSRGASHSGSPIPTLRAGEPPARLQRLVRTSLVTCPAGQNPYGADRRASALLDHALTRIAAARAARAANPADPDVVAVGNALHRAFGMNPAADHTWTASAPTVALPVIARRLEIAKGYIDSVVFTVRCIVAGAPDVIPGCAAGTCDPGTEAFSCHANRTVIDLCPPFWALGLDQRARTWAHEVFHIDFGFINDWGQPDVHNAHCYAQFIALLNGFNSPPGFRCH